MRANWKADAQLYIREATKDLPPDADLTEHRRALRKVASDFHCGTSWGKKVWSIEARKHLEKHGLPPRTVADASPQSKLFQRASSGDIIFPYRDGGNSDVR